MGHRVKRFMDYENLAAGWSFLRQQLEVYSFMKLIGL